MKITEPLFINNPLNKDLSRVGHLIRIGSIRDGGYYVTHRAVLESSFLISGGISFNAEFERDFHSINLDAQIIMVDKSFSIIKNILRIPYWFIFKRSMLGYISTSIDSVVLAWCFGVMRKFIGKEYGVNDILRLVTKSGRGYIKLDIEGSEYEILIDLIKNEDHFNGVIIEFHDVDQHLECINRYLGNSNLELVDIHVNEIGGLGFGDLPKSIEVSLLRKEYCSRNDFEIYQSNRFSNLSSNRPIIVL